MTARLAWVSTVGPLSVTYTQSGTSNSGTGSVPRWEGSDPNFAGSRGIRWCLFQRAALTYRPFRAGVAELAAEARLPTPGDATESERTLRRTRLGMGSTPPVIGGFPLRC